MERTLLEKICLFITCLFLPIFCLLLVLDGYMHYKVHQFTRYHEGNYVYHDFCIKVEHGYYCSDNYIISN